MIRVFAFAGGAVFVASLAYCAWWYLAGPVDWSVVVAGRPVRDGAALAQDLALFGLFAGHHSLFAREPVKRVLARALPPPLLRSVYVWTASLLLIAACALWIPIGGLLYEQTGPWAVVHAAVQLAGLGLTFAAVRRLDPFELAGIHEPAPGDGLQITGPYRWVRHPIYLGWALMVFGAARMTSDRFAFAVMSTAYLAAAIPWEERSLRRIFGDDYRAYQRRVRWRMLPGIY